jgi:hypothetical protein
MSARLKSILIATTLAAVGLSLTACGHSVDHSTPQAIQADLQKNGFVCVGYEKGDPMLGRLNHGTCMHEGREIQISLFANADARDRILDATAEYFGEMGATNGMALVDDAWMVEAKTVKDVQDAQKILGGKIR